MTFWTAEKVEQLKSLADGTRSATRLASELGCPRNAVIAKLHRAKGALGRLQHKATTRRRSYATVRQPAPAPKPQPVKVAKASIAHARPTPPAVPINLPVAALPAAPPMPFGDAVELGRCLHFVGDPFSDDGPGMPVCGAERAQDAGYDNRYCRPHLISCTGVPPCE